MRRSTADWPKEPIQERECSSCNGTAWVLKRDFKSVSVDAPPLLPRGSLPSLFAVDVDQKHCRGIATHRDHFAVAGTLGRVC
jgi:hypothetical protein